MKVRNILISLGSWVLVLLFLGVVPLYADSYGDFVPGELVCQMVTGYPVSAINSTYGTTTVTYLPHSECYLLRTQPGQNAESLATVIEARSDVFYCGANYILDAPEAVQSSQPFLDAAPTKDPMTQPAATTLQLSSVQSITTGANVKVAVVDVGVDFNQPALTGIVTSGFDFVSNDGNAADEYGGSGSGHGTFIAGIIHLVAPDAQQIAFRVLDTNGRGDGFSIAKAVMQAIDDSCNVINLSCVMSGQHGALDLAIEYAKTHNVMVIAAAGNDSGNVELFPASDSYALGVAALDSNDLKTSFSNYNPKIDLSAPGQNIYAPFLGTSYAWWNGTSFAAPFVAATAALVYSVHPKATWNEVRDALCNTAIDLDVLNPQYAGLLGAGRVNPTAAVQYAQQFCCSGSTGDINQLGVVDLSDLSLLIAYLTGFRSTLLCPKEANINSTGSIDLADLSILISYLTGVSHTLPQCQ